MIRFLIDDKGTLQVQQLIEQSCVYLDHWALRKLSEDPARRNRLVSALKSRGGTLMLSWLNLAEFTQVTDPAQARAAEELVEVVLPNVFFLEVNPFTVWEKEDELLAGGKPAAPHADTEFLQAFSTLRPTSVNPFTARDLFTAVQERGKTEGFDSLADTITRRIDALRDVMDSDAEFEKLVRRTSSGPQIQHGTRYVLRELSRTFLTDRRTKLTRNHAIDLLHSVVPVAYCDLVLLDRHWRHQVELMRSRFAKVDMNVPLAQVYSERNNGVEEFLSALERGNEA